MLTSSGADTRINVAVSVKASNVVTGRHCLGAPGFISLDSSLRWNDEISVFPRNDKHLHFAGMAKVGNNVFVVTSCNFSSYQIYSGIHKIVTTDLWIVAWVPAFAGMTKYLYSPGMTKYLYLAGITKVGNNVSVTTSCNFSSYQIYSGIHKIVTTDLWIVAWIPAFAGMTKYLYSHGMTKYLSFTGMTKHLYSPGMTKYLYFAGMAKVGNNVSVATSCNFFVIPDLFWYP